MRLKQRVEKLERQLEKYKTLTDRLRGEIYFEALSQFGIYDQSYIELLNNFKDACLDKWGQEVEKIPSQPAKYILVDKPKKSKK